MQHVLPSRNVCVAYHGMTVPLPVASLCSALAPPAKRSTCTKHPQLKAAKDPQLKAALCNGASVDGRLVNSDVENDRDGELREDKNEKWMEQQPCISENRCEQEVALQSTAPADPKSCVGVTSEEKKSEKAYDCNDMISSSPEGGLASVNGSSKVTMWSSVGRGKSLRQLVSTIKHNPGPIGKRHPSLMSHHCSYVPTSQLEEGKKDPESLSPQTHEDTTTEEKMPLLICADDEQTSTELSACAPLPMLQAQLGLASSPSLGDRDVRQDKKENTVQNTSRSQRKPKVSLAIQFKGAATPVGLSPSEQIHSVSPVGLMRPKDFEIQATSGKGRSGEMLNLTSSVDDQVISDDEGCLELDRKIDQGPKQLYTQDQRCNGSLEDRQIFPSQGNDGSDRVQKHNGEKREVSLQSSSENSTSISCSFLSSLTSSSEDELGFVESRLGRKTGDLEKSIAMHQRNIHRNQVCHTLRVQLFASTIFATGGKNCKIKLGHEIQSNYPPPKKTPYM